MYVSMHAQNSIISDVYVCIYTRTYMSVRFSVYVKRILLYAYICT